MNRIPSRLVYLTLAISSSLAANIINVPADSVTIQSAIDGAVNGDTVLVQPGTYPENILWPDVNGIKLLSAGDTSDTIIDGDTSGSVIHMNPTTATIDSTTEIRGFKITNGGNIADGGGMFVSNASPVLARLWVTGNTASYGGGLYFYDSSPTLTDVTVTVNTVTYNGGGLYIWGGNPTLTNVTVTGNASTVYGGGLWIGSGSPTLTHVTATGNTADVGGGVYIVGSSPTLSDVIVTDNTANSAGGIYGGQGGGLYIDSGSPALTQVTVTGNTASHTGGGLYIREGDPTLTDVTVTGNAASNGGGLYIWEGSPTLTDVKVTDNSAVWAGGGLYIENYSSPTLTNVTVTGNRTDTMYGNGGGLYISSGSPTLTHVTVAGNTASWGGGLNIGSSSNPTLTDVTVAGNTATNHGGGLYIIYSSSPTLTDVTVSGNTASYGGGLWIDSGTPTIVGSNIAYNGTGLHNADNTNTIDADSVWWGNSSGPYHPQQNPGGLGDSVNAFVNITPFLTQPDTAAPPIPVQNLIVTNQGDDSIDLAWDASPIGDLAGYKVYYDTDSTGFPYADTVDVAADTSFTLSGLPLGTTIYLAVTCYDTDGNESWYSKEVIAAPINTPPGSFALLTPPADTVMTRYGSAIWDAVTFSWDSAIDPDGDSISYHFEPQGEYAWLFPVVDTSATTISLIPQIALLGNGMGYDTLALTWNVAATDGLNSTWSVDGPRALTLAIDYPVVIEIAPSIPHTFALHQNYPNPFNPTSTIQYDLPAAVNVTLVVYDILGREVVRLVDQEMQPGYHVAVWNGKGADGRTLPTGIYIARLVAPGYSKSIKMLLLK